MNVIDKIQALKRLSENASATPAEAASAAARIQELLIKHKLSEADIGLGDEEEIKRHEDPLWQSKNYSRWRSALASGIAHLNACRVLRSKTNSGTKFSIVGKATDVEVVRHLFAYVVREIERHARTYLSVSSGRPNAKMRGSSYRLGFVDSVLSKLEAQKNQTRAEAEANGQSRGLIRLDQDDAAIEAWVKAQSHLKHVTPKAVGVESNSFREGQLDGSKLAIRSALRAS